MSKIIEASLKIKSIVLPLIWIGKLTIELIKGENLGPPTFEGKISPHTTIPKEREKYLQLGVYSYLGAALHERKNLLQNLV
jgi:hypothetical protein